MNSHCAYLASDERESAIKDSAQLPSDLVAIRTAKEARDQHKKVPDLFKGTRKPLPSIEAPITISNTIVNAGHCQSERSTHTSGLGTDDVYTSVCQQRTNC